MQRIILALLIIVLMALLWFAFFPKSKGDKPHPKWMEAPWIWLLVSGVTAAIFGLFFGMAFHDGARESEYIPYHQKSHH